MLDGVQTTKVSRSLMITDELLLGCLAEAGFVDARTIDLEAEGTYKPFVATREA